MLQLHKATLWRTDWSYFEKVQCYHGRPTERTSSRNTYCLNLIIVTHKYIFDSAQRSQGMRWIMSAVPTGRTVRMDGVMFMHVSSRLSSHHECGHNPVRSEAGFRHTNASTKPWPSTGLRCRPTKLQTCPQASKFSSKHKYLCNKIFTGLPPDDGT